MANSSYSAPDPMPFPMPLALGGTGVTTLDALKALVRETFLVWTGLSTTTVNSALITNPETSMFTSGQGYAGIPANWLKVGSRIQIQAIGYLNTLLTPSLRFRTKMGGATVWDSNTFVLSALSNLLCVVEIEVIVRTVGTGGTIQVQGWVQYGSTRLSAINTTTSTVNTTVDLPIDVTVQWGTLALGNAFTTTQSTITIFNM